MFVSQLRRVRHDPSDNPPQGGTIRCKASEEDGIARGACTRDVGTGLKDSSLNVPIRSRCSYSWKRWLRV
eukprot:3398793-Pyramimonas_sp.AAC.1